MKLHHSLQRLTSGLGKDSLGLGYKRKEEDLAGKAIKVMDLLQHSTELGNMDALYTLAKVSLVGTPHQLLLVQPFVSIFSQQFPPTPHFTLDPHLAFDSFSAHAFYTGNASSQAYLAFFYATGYGNIVPINQALSQLYYTFAANGGEKGAQMALGYRYWSGIGTSEKCSRAMAWYERAAEQGRIATSQLRTAFNIY